MTATFRVVFSEMPEKFPVLVNTKKLITHSIYKVSATIFAVFEALTNLYQTV